MPCCWPSGNSASIKKVETTEKVVFSLDDVPARIRAAENAATNEAVTFNEVRVNSKVTDGTWAFVFGVKLNTATPAGVNNNALRPVNSKHVGIFMTAHDTHPGPVRVTVEMAVLSKGKKGDPVHKVVTPVHILNSGDSINLAPSYLEKAKLAPHLKYGHKLFLRVAVTVLHNKERTIGRGFKNIVGSPSASGLAGEEKKASSRASLHNPNFMKEVNRLPRPELFSDFALVGQDGVSVPVCKLILAARSPVFAANLASKGTAEAATATVVIADYESATLRRFWQFLLGDEDPAPMVGNVQLAMDLLALADKYEVKGLFDSAETQLALSVRKDNAAEILKLADKVRAKKLENSVLDFLKANQGAIQPNELAELPKDVVAKIFARMAKK